MMSAVVLDSFERENSIGSTLGRLLEEKGEEFSYFKLKDMNIKRCMACGACADRTPGKCVINDDMQEVFKAVAKGDWLIMLTTLSFGGYSSQLKIAVDRFMVLGLPLYFVKDGTLFHRSRYNRKNLFCIALAEKNLQGQEENFRKIVSQNAANLSYTGRAIVFKSSDDITKVELDISNVLKEVKK